MKKAFTMLELVFVIVIVGILSVMIAPNFQGNNLRQAADQVVSHIRYTQHLAMMDNKFDTNDTDWYRERWQIFFSLTYNSTISYSIFSDKNQDGNPSHSLTGYKEVARNPLDSSKYLIGTSYSSFFGGTKPEKVSSNLDIKSEYGVLNIVLSSECRLSGSTRIAFDNIGRPLRGTFHGVSWNSSYPTSTNINNSKLISDTCKIVLCNTTDCLDENVTIAIEPETGYTHIL